MMERSLTTEELFNRIQTILKAKNKSPDTFSYRLPAKFTEQKGVR